MSSATTSRGPPPPTFRRAGFLFSHTPPPSPPPPSPAHATVFDLDGTGEPAICYYNGYRADVDVIGDPAGSVPPHAGALGIETMAQTGVPGRGVLIDLERSVGHERVAVGYDLLTEIMAAQDLTVEAGDILCLHTGLTALMLDL